MKKRAFWIASLVSFLAAFFLQWDAMIKASYGIHKETLSGNGDLPEVQRQTFLVEAQQFFRTAHELRYAGIAVAVLCVAFLFTSRRRKEPILRWPIVVILVFYLLLPFAPI
jgi:hypothetical protein